MAETVGLSREISGLPPFPEREVALISRDRLRSCHLPLELLEDVFGTDYGTYFEEFTAVFEGLQALGRTHFTTGMSHGGMNQGLGIGHHFDIRVPNFADEVWGTEIKSTAVSIIKADAGEKWENIGGLWLAERHLKGSSIGARVNKMDLRAHSIALSAASRLLQNSTAS